MNNVSNAKQGARSLVMVRLYPQQAHKVTQSCRLYRRVRLRWLGFYSLSCGVTMLDGDHLATSGDALATVQLER